MDPERTALASLVRSAGGRATIEPVSMLALAVLSPWAGDRHGLRDRPNRMAPNDPGPLFSFLADMAPHLSPNRLPTDRGMLGWMAHRRMAAPVAGLSKVPTWVTDPALAEGWLCLPPVAGYRQGPVGPDVIEADGRVAALHLLVSQAANGSDPTGVPRDAVELLLSWFMGPHAAHWSSAAGNQCSRMACTLANGSQRAWFLSYGVVPVEPVAQVITRAVPLVSESWRHVPTEAELAAERERERILAEGRAQTKEWQERSARGWQPVG